MIMVLFLFNLFSNRVYYLKQFQVHRKTEQQKVQRFPICYLPPHMHTLPHDPNSRPKRYFCYNEPTLMHHYCPKSIAYVKVHPWYCTFYGFKQMYNDMYLPLQYHINQFYCLKVFSDHNVCFGPKLARFKLSEAISSYLDSMMRQKSFFSSLFVNKRIFLQSNFGVVVQPSEDLTLFKL